MEIGDDVSGHRVLVTTRSFSSGSIDVVGLLESTGVRVIRGSAVHDPVELITVLATADAWIAGRAPITDGWAGLRVLDILEAASRSLEFAGAVVPLRAGR